MDMSCIAASRTTISSVRSGAPFAGCDLLSTRFINLIGKLFAAEARRDTVPKSARTPDPSILVVGLIQGARSSRRKLGNDLPHFGGHIPRKERGVVVDGLRERQASE